MSRLITVALVVAAATTACNGSSDAPTARFEIMQYPEEGRPGATFKGIGDFDAEEVSYTLFLEGKPSLQRQEFGRVISYTGGDDEWYKSEQTPGASAAVSVRNNLVASTQALEYLRSIADEVTEVGAETVRGADTTHFRATAHLTQLGAPPEDDRFPVEVWVDKDGRTRRYRYQLVGSEETFVWEFFDFGVKVDLEPPPPGQVK